MTDNDIHQRIEDLKQELNNLRQGLTSCTSNAEREYLIMELEDELDELQGRLRAEGKAV